jgi:serine/threonine-protein kinase RsbW
MIEEWTLPDDLSAAPAAREHIHARLVGRLPPHSVDDLVLIASELAANAVRHGEPPAVLRLETTDEVARSTVSSHGGTTAPKVLDAGDDADHGRGLAMVQALASDVGWQRDGDRLDVWADVELSR